MPSDYGKNAAPAMRFEKRLKAILTTLCNVAQMTPFGTPALSHPAVSLRHVHVLAADAPAKSPIWEVLRPFTDQS